jgi:hypothetical protein
MGKWCVLSYTGGRYSPPQTSATVLKRNLITGLLACLALYSPAALQAQIYRCETPQGVVFADTPCGAEAAVVELRQETAGVSIGPGEEVREYLAQRRTERSEQREARLQAQASADAQPAPQVITVQQPLLAPGFWPGYFRPRPPLNRPDRPGQPNQPARPGRPGQILPEPAPRPGNSIINPRGR